MAVAFEDRASAELEDVSERNGFTYIHMFMFHRDRNFSLQVCCVLILQWSALLYITLASHEAEMSSNSCLTAFSVSPVALRQFPIMALPPADASSTPPLSQDVLLFNYKQYVIVVPEEFSAESSTLSNLQARAIDVGAVYSVSHLIRVHMFVGTFGALRGICVQVNLPPTAREEFTYQSIGYPLCLIEDKNLVVAAVLYASIPACAQFRMDDRLINLMDHGPSYKAFLERIHQPTYRRLRPATPTISATAPAPHLQTVLALPTRTKRRASFESTEDTTLLLSGPQLKRQCTEPKSRPPLAIELEQFRDTLVQESRHVTYNSAEENLGTVAGYSSHLECSHKIENAQNEVPSNRNQPKRQQNDLELKAPPTSYVPSLQYDSPTYLLHERAFTQPDLYALDKLQTTIRDAITKVGMIAMQRIISMCMENLEPSRSPGIAPPWWPTEMKPDQLAHLKEDALISVTVNLFWYYRPAIRSAMKDRMLWATELREKVFLPHVIGNSHRLSQATVEAGHDKKRMFSVAGGAAASGPVKDPLSPC